MLRHRAGLLLIAVLAAAACEDSTEPLPTLNGCYDLVLGTWRPAPEQYIEPPTRVENKPEIGDNGLETGRTVVRAAAGSTPNHYRWSWWQSVGSDSVVVVFSTGFTGLRFDLNRAGTTLTGRGQTFADHPEVTAFADVTLSPRPCS